MPLYCGIDLHAKSSYLAIIDEQRKRIFRRNVPNDKPVVLGFLAPYKHDLAGVVVESTFNWYWLVDALMEEGYTVHLANPCAIKQYLGLKYVDDKHDAFWLADLLSLGILKEGYIYPKEQRPVRDLLRKRGLLVRLRTSLLTSLQNTVVNTFGTKIPAHRIKGKEDHVTTYDFGNESLALMGRVSKTSIDILTRQIEAIESHIYLNCRLAATYNPLVSLPGVGKILGATILLETGPITRFPAVGNYVSYCRKAETVWTSSDKVKGKGNRKNGNRYLAWAFSEAAEHARRFDTASRNFYNRKLRERNSPVAHNALANKLARAAYYIMRDQVPYKEAKLFG
jgi:transposase